MNNELANSKSPRELKWLVLCPSPNFAQAVFSTTNYAAKKRGRSYQLLAIPPTGADPQGARAPPQKKPELV